MLRICLFENHSEAETFSTEIQNSRIYHHPPHTNSQGTWKVLANECTICESCVATPQCIQYSERAEMIPQTAVL